MTIEAARPGADAGDLAEFGYEQQLRRRLGSYHSFAAGFSFVSVLTTVFQLFAFGFFFGGASFFWTWPLVFAGQLMVALCFAELAARFPISGCIYQWSRRLSTPTFGWFAGWTMMVAQVVTVAAAAIALQVVLPTIWSGFQLVGGDPSPTTVSGATNAVLLGAILVTLTTLINAVGVRAMARINSIGVTIELVAVVALIILLFTQAQRGPEAVMEPTGAAPFDGYLGAFIVSALMAAYVMVGFDSAGELSEETKDPRRTAPRTIIGALCISALFGGLLLLAGILAAPSLTDGTLAADGLPGVLTAALGTTLGKVFLGSVAIAICVCTLAIQTAASRMLFSMSRDRMLPGSSVLSKVSPRTGAPIAPTVAVGAGAIVVLAVNLGDGSVFTALTSVCIVLMYLAYLMVTGPLLVARLRGKLPPAQPGLFSLGRFALPVNAVAVVYGAAMMINLIWPRASVYNPNGDQPIGPWFGVLFVTVVLLLGTVVYRIHRPKRYFAPEPTENAERVAVKA